MVCRLCGRRPARRACPALRENICTVCCGTKRQRDIACPPDCQFLVAARQHPAAVVRKQQEEDLRAFLPLVQNLNQRQEQLMSAVLLSIRGHRGDALFPTTDDDVQAAAAALAATYETASRGLIYEERPGSLPAQRLIGELQPLLARITQGADAPRDKDLAVVFRAVEKGARDARKTLPGGKQAYLELLKRIISAAPEQPREPDPVAGPSLVQPGGSLIIRP